MKVKTECYDCRLSDGRGHAGQNRKRRRRLLKPEPPWSAHAKDEDSEKLYIVRHDGEICYVGRTGTSVKARVQEGLNARYPYGWRHYSRVDICVCLLGGTADRDYGEGVEAELVHLLRLGDKRRVGKWPSNQHEIHFRHTDGRPDRRCVSVAKNVYREVMRWEFRPATLSDD